MPESWDVVIAGGGTAGMTAALFAAHRGARVLVIEQATELGGSLHLSAGRLSAAGTRLQARRGIQDSSQRHFDDAMRISRSSANASALRRVIDHGAETLHWLLDVGFQVLPEHPIIDCEQESYATPRTYYGPEGALSILKALLPAYRSQERAGKIKTMLGTEAIGISQQAAGAVASFRVRDETNITGEVRGKNFVLATGGYANHAERFRRWTRRPHFPWAHANSCGSGQQMGLDAGGVLQHGDKFSCTFAGVRDPRAPGSCPQLTALIPQWRKPWEIYINLEGKRFMREDEPSAFAREQALLAQPDLSFWAVYDAGIAATAPEPFVTGLPLEELGPLWNEHPSFKRADSIGELARSCGMDAGALTRAAQVYNNAVSNQLDPAFGREYLPRSLGSAPYFAILHHGVTQVGWAGLAVDEQMNVVTRDGAAIPHLYAVGESQGFGLTNGNAFIGGMGLQPALTLARLLGQRMLRW
jgi:fumarate reductase flavoprotein subunit